MTTRTRQLVEVSLWALVAAIMVALMVVSVRPIDRESMVMGSDKVSHALAYGALACSLVAALRVGSRWSAARVAAVAFAWATAYGALNEVLQLFVGRSCEWVDALANAAGAGVVALAWLCLEAWRTARRQGDAAA